MSSSTTLELIGGQGGGPYSFTGEKNGASLQKIGVWVGDLQVRGIAVWLSDDRSQTFGEPSGSHQEYIFQPGECFTALSLWDNGEGTRLGAIKFKTNKDGEFFAKMNKDLKKEYMIDVGSGYCLGVEGRSGAVLDCMGFMFLNAVQSAVLTNVNYPTINQMMPKVTMEEVKTLTFTNKGSANQEQTIETSKKLIKKSSWSMSQSFTSSFSVEVKAGIPEVAEVSSGFIVSIGAENTYKQKHREEKTETLSTTVVVPPKKKVDVDITIGIANFVLPYTGTVTVTCQNGCEWQYETKGQYKGVTYTDFKVKTTESDL